MSAVESLRFFVPELIVLGGAFIALLLDVFTSDKKAIGIFSILTLILAAFFCKAPTVDQPLFSGLFILDSQTHFFRFVILGIISVTLLASMAFKPLKENECGEYYSLFLFMAFALILMGATTHLLMMFMAIEFVSILSYLLVGFLKKNAEAKEAAMKYFLFGSLASGVMLFGMSLLFGATGSLHLDGILTLMNSGLVPVATLAVIFILVGLGFKISMAPFHMWAPDVYEAAPTPVTAFLTVAPKALGFAVILRVLGSITPLDWNWVPLIAALAMITMTVGNVIAISQNNIKRLLAYSSIAQAGYILMGIAAFSRVGYLGVLIYLVAYAFTNLGAFVIVMFISNHTESEDIAAYAGLSKRSPLLAASLTIFLLSLAGIPPLVGFIGKFFVFAAVIQAKLYTLAIVAALNSAVAAFYYFKVVRLMYLAPAAETSEIPQPMSMKLALAVTLIGTLALGLLPQHLLAFVSYSF